MSRRTERIGEEVRAELARLLLAEATDPRLRLVSLTRVDVAPDLSHAQVHWSAMPAPDCDTSMMRQPMLDPFGRMSVAAALRGVKRPCRRSSGRLRMWRLASQVSCAASLSRLRGVAEIVMAKPLTSVRAITPSRRPRWST